MPPKLLQETAKIARTLPKRHPFKDAISSMFFEGGSPWSSVFIPLLLLSNRVESMDIRLFAPWTTRVSQGLITDPLQRILWDFLLRQRRLQGEILGSDGHTRVFPRIGPDGRLVGDRHNGERMPFWPLPLLRKVTMVFNDPYVPYKVPRTFTGATLPWKWHRDKHVEIDVIPQADNWAHTNIMARVAELAGGSHQTPPRELLEKPELIPLLGADQYLVFVTYLDRLKNIRYLKDMGLEKHIDSFRRLQLPSAKEDLSGLDRAKHDVFLEAYKLVASKPRQGRLRTPTIHCHLQLFEFIEVLRDQSLYFENQVDATKVMGLTLTHTRAQCDIAEESVDERSERAWHRLDNRLAFFPELQALHLPLFMSHRLSKQVYPWEPWLLPTGDVEGNLGWANLRNLTKLKELTITFSALAGKDEPLASLESLITFLRSLPPSLETLNLVEWFSCYSEVNRRMPGGWGDGDFDWAYFLNFMLEFLDNLASAIVRVRPSSLKRIEVSYMEETRFTDAFRTVEQRWMRVVKMLGISLVLKPFRLCEEELFGPKPVPVPED